MSISSRLPRRFYLLSVVGLLLPALGAAAPVGELRSPASRDLQQMRESAERYRVQDEVEQMQERRRELESQEAPQAPAKEDESGLHFELKGIEHDKSLILTDEEIAQAVEPFIGREVGMKDVRDLLEAVNALYREKGYVVCEARLKPQRIRNGVLFVTLIEGRTGKVSVTGAEHTREGYVLDAFDLSPGEVANYREMSEDLVWFNMTNDVVLSIDIRAGEEPGTTDYEIAAREPANWTATVFADTTGTRSTGRPRAGASVTNRSLFGRRDSATVLGIASEGSKSAMVSYSLPLTSRGTRLTASASWGKVDVIQGPSVEGDVEGRSSYYALRLDHPVYADADQKWTIFGEWNRQKSETDFFDVTIADTRIDTWRAGAEMILLGDRSVLYATMGLGRSTVHENTFGERWEQNILTGSAYWRFQATEKTSLTASAAWQSLLGGDDLHTTQYFYLGHTSGVRGYENDVISAESGAWVNLEASYAVAGPLTSLFAFVDAGKLGGETAYSKTGLASVGAGLRWPLWSGASVTGTMSVPLVRHLGDDIHVNKARFDLAVVAVW